MTIPTPTIKAKDLFYWLLLIILAAFLFKQCTKKSPSQSLAIETAKKQVIDSSQKVLVNFKDSVTKVIAQREDRADSILGEATVFEYERNQAWGVIKDRDNMINSLSSKILDDHGTNDTECVELAKRSQIQSKQLHEQEEITVKLLDDLHLLSKVKDSTLADERRIKDAGLKQGMLTATAYSDLFAKFKNMHPPSSVWIGPEMQLSPSYQTVGGQIMYASKGGTGWLLGAGITTGADYYIKAGLLLKISLKRK